MSILDPLAPYVGLLKVAGVALIFCVSVFGGCRWQASHDAGKLATKDAAMAVYAADIAALSNALNEVNAAADQAKRDAAAQAAYAVQAVRQADRDREAYDKKLEGVTDALERAKREPVCRAQLETPLCVELL